MYSLSVILPVYNAAKYLTGMLDSLAAQTVKNEMQIILVDDGSTDGSAEICDEFASAHTDTVVIHRKNGGVSAARNAGIKEASGEYIGFVDADDTVAPDYFEKLLNAAKENDCDMAFSSLTFVLSNENRVYPEWYKAGQILNRSELHNSFARKMLSNSAQNSACIKIFRNSIIEENKIFFPTGVKIAEDKHFVLDFLKHCNSAVCTGDMGYFYLDVPSSAMHTNEIIDQLLSTYEDEIQAFLSLGLDAEIIRVEKAAFLFYSFADFLQHCYLLDRKKAKKAAKKYFADTFFMEKIDNSIEFIKQNNGRIFSYLATAFAKRSVFMTLTVLFIQKLINERNS